MLNTDKELKLYYSIAEVADMFGVNASLLRFLGEGVPRRFLPGQRGRGGYVSIERRMWKRLV